MGFLSKIFSKKENEEAAQLQNQPETAAAEQPEAVTGEAEQPETGIDLTAVTHDTLQFDHFAFKLAVIQVLMYEMNLLGDPYEEGEKFAREHWFDYEEGTDEDYEHLKQHRIAAKRYFETLEIPRELAEKVEHICADQSNDIYYQIDPLHGDFDERDWEGRPYYIDDISDRELLPFTNLKSIVFNGFNAGGQTLITKLKARGMDVQDSDM